MRSTKLLKVGFALAVVAGILGGGVKEARAETDTFGTGDGHNGAKTVAALNEVINSYAALTVDAPANAMSVTIASGGVVGDPAGFAAGDLVMVWQAAGLAAADALGVKGNSGSLDLTTAGGGVTGRFELARITTITNGGNQLNFGKPLTRAFASKVSQVVKVPEYTTVNVPQGTSVAARPWEGNGTDGWTGGVIAFLATGAVTNEGIINANNAGFRGGVLDNRALDLTLACNASDGTPADGYANKGEGVVSTFAPPGGRDNISNGGGGGNCTWNGGAGGGNFGKGGAGGTATIATVIGQQSGGRGGGSLGYTMIVPPGSPATVAARLSLGGGGGAGEQKNGVGSAGGRGGGAIFLRSRSLAGAGTISANGETAANAALLGLVSDGAGGGGAGGTVLIRVVDSAVCGGVQARGGKGGNSQTVGLSTFAPGGGGAGGRVEIQAKVATACPTDVVGGANGTSGAALNPANAQPGAAGSQIEVPAPGGGYCFSNPRTNPECQDPVSVCDTTSGFCFKCTGPAGTTNTAHPCPNAFEPICKTDGACVPCTGDLGTNGDACQTPQNPYCIVTGPDAGTCDKCKADMDCVGPTHPGPKCNVTQGNCGTACTMDSECKSTEWCSQGVCTPKTPNGDPVPNVPPIDGECTLEKGKRVCLSSVCEVDDDLCGLKNSSPCDATEKCRSKICFGADKRCGLPAGEPCSMNGECRSGECEAGKCKGCKVDKDCNLNQHCDAQKSECLPGCRVQNGETNCLKPQICSATDGSVGQCIDPNASSSGALDDFGLIEGGGCACRTSTPSRAAGSVAIAGVAICALAFVRRRRKDNDKDRG